MDASTGSAPDEQPAGEQGVVANHHAHHPGFSGLTGYLAAATMVVGRGGAARVAADLVVLDTTDHVVDIGCGPGAAARIAGRRNARVTGVDPSPEMLRVARWLSPGRLIEWLEGVAESLPLADDSATVAWSLAAVHHWPDIERGLAEVGRVLGPGGRFVAIERRTRPGAKGLASHGWTDQQADRFAEDCRAAGLVDVEVSCHRPGRSRLLAVLAHTPLLAR